MNVIDEIAAMVEIYLADHGIEQTRACLPDAIRAMKAQQTTTAAAGALAPEGWKLVPVEPTRVMVDAARTHHEGELYLPHSLYCAMLAAAPAAPAVAPTPEGCTPADAEMLRAANHQLAAENDHLRRRLRPFAQIASSPLSWAMIEYCIDGDPEKQTLQAPQMQRAFNRAADALREDVPCVAADAPAQPCGEDDEKSTRIAALEAENFALSAGQCVHPKGVARDEGGSACCPLTGTRDAQSFGAAAAEQADEAVTVAAMNACALMIKGICLTLPQEKWVDAIRGRIRFMLAAHEKDSK